MSSNVYDILDEIAASGRRLRLGLAGDYKPTHEDGPTGEALARVYVLILSWPAMDLERQQQEETT